MNITHQRAGYLKSLKLDDKSTGKTGGTPSAGWTRAAHLAGLRSVPYWSGFLPTPARHFDAVVIEAMHNAPENLKFA